MQLTVEKSALSKVLAFTQSIVERKTTMPILANVLLSAQDGALKVSVTDLEITSTATVPANISNPGSTTVNAKVFAELVRELPESEIALSLQEGERLEITCGKSTHKMVGVSADEYPSLPGLSLKTKTTISSSQFLDMVGNTSYAVSADETRFNLTGVCFELIEEGTLRMTATDGHRLALISRPVEGLQFEGEVIVPKKGLVEVRKIIDQTNDKPLGIWIEDGFLILESDSLKVAMRLIDGEFPDIKQVLPKKKSSQKAVVPSAGLAQALKRVALMVTDKAKCVKLDFSSEMLRISSHSAELGEANEELEISFTGEPVSVGFNAKYLLDIASTLNPEENLVVELNGELGPGKFYPERDESCIGIVMPMRLS